MKNMIQIMIVVIIIIIIINMGVSLNDGIPKWMVYTGKPY